MSAGKRTRVFRRHISRRYSKESEQKLWAAQTSKSYSRFAVVRRSFEWADQPPASVPHVSKPFAGTYILTPLRSGVRRPRQSPSASMSGVRRTREATRTLPDARRSRAQRGLAQASSEYRDDLGVWYTRSQVSSNPPPR